MPSYISIPTGILSRGIDMGNAQHEFILSFLGIYEKQDETFLVSPYMENGTLAQWRKNPNPSVVEIWERVWLFASPPFVGAHPR